MNYTFKFLKIEAFGFVKQTKKKQKSTIIVYKTFLRRTNNKQFRKKHIKYKDQRHIQS